MKFFDSVRDFFAPQDDDTYESEPVRENPRETRDRRDYRDQIVQDDYDDYEEDTSAQEVRVPAAPLRETRREAPESPRSGSNKVVNIQATAQLQVVLVKPEVFTDAKQIADHLIAKKTVVLNLETASAENKRRIIDFLVGVAYANGGSLKPVANLTYIITPYNVGFIGEDLVNERVREAGEQAAFDAGIHDLHPEIVKTLGALKYRTSFGQNVLSHSVQVSALCGIMASELGLDATPAKRAGLLHDLGKAIDHEVEGPHAILGADLCRRYGERPEIVHAVEAHHADVEPNTVLDVLVQAADAISAARPGARRESAETYIKRLEKLEEISNAHEGVERTYAMQAGRELHVMVEPERISDAQAIVLAHDIAKQIEDEMEYPGQVRVVVIRESRAVDIAK